MRISCQVYSLMNYNPFDLNPPKSVIKSALDQFKTKAMKLLADIASLRQNELAGWLIEEKQRSHQQLMHKIKRYQMYLDGVDVSQDWEAAKLRAKQVQIKDIFQGKLRKLGQRYVGSCPFHNDKSPSFVIYPTNDAHCFGCGWNGDIIDFIMKRDNLDFKSAVKLLAG